MDIQTINMQSSTLQATVRECVDGHDLTNLRVPQAALLYKAWEELGHKVPFPDQVANVDVKDLIGIRGFVSETYKKEYGIELLFPIEPKPEEVETLRKVLLEFADASELKSRLILDGAKS